MQTKNQTEKLEKIGKLIALLGNPDISDEALERVRYFIEGFKCGIQSRSEHADDGQAAQAAPIERTA